MKNNPYLCINKKKQTRYEKDNYNGHDDEETWKLHLC